MPIAASGEQIRDILTKYRRIAVVGLSNDPSRPSYDVAAYLQRHGYEIFPVNPVLKGQTVLGREVYGSLQEVPQPVEIVDVFRRSEFVPAVVDDALAAGARVIWTQLGVRHDEALRGASEAGVTVVEDRCTKVEHARLGVGRVG
jgi:predicted CoA-binding protein